MAQNTGNAHITITVNGNEAINFYNKLKKEEKELLELAKQGDEEAKKKLADVQKMLTDVEKEMEKVDDVLKGKVFVNLSGLEKMARRVKERMRYADNIEDLRKLQIQYKGLTDRIRMLNNENNNFTASFGRLFQRAAEYTSFYMILNRGRQVITNAISGNLKLSDSISDIQKVSGLSEESVKGLVAQIEKLDSRNSPEVLNNMAYAAGKLGIKGAENLLGFTAAADKLNVALKEYLGDGPEGVVKLMKFANVMGTTEKFGVEQALLKTGSALNYMTQSTAAAADYMIEFAGRFGPIARQARMTSGDVIGLASALDALTVNNEEAATSLQKFVVRLLSAPTAVSKALGMSASQAKEMVETGRSIELVEQALVKLGERAEKYGVSGIASVIGDIGSKGQAQRLIKTLATLSNNTQMVHDYVVMANDAFEKGTSVIDEYNIKNQNAAAIMERMRNSWEKIMVNSENVGVVKEMAQELMIMSQRIQESTSYMFTLKVALGYVFGLFKGLIQVLPLLLVLLVSFTTVKLLTTIGSWTTALGLFIKNIYLAITAQKALNSVLVKSVWGAIALGIGVAVGYLIDFVSATLNAQKNVDEFNTKIKGLTTSTEDYNKELYRESREMDNLFARAKAANEKTDEKRKLIAEINTKYGKYIGYLLNEKSGIDEIAKAQEVANEALRQNIALKVKQSKLEQIGETFAEKGGKALETFRSGTERRGIPTDEIYKAQERIQELLRENLGKAGYTGPNQATVTILKELAKEDNRWNDVVNNREIPTTLGGYRQKWEREQGEDFLVHHNYEDLKEMYATEKEMVLANKEAYKGVFDYVASVIEVTKAERKVNELYAPMIGDLEDRLNKQKIEEDRTTVIETPDKKGHRDPELMQAQRDVQGIKGELTAFYEWRESEINAMRDRGEITEAVKDMLVDANKSLHATSEMNAWKYLLGDKGAKEVWREQLKIMESEILNSNPEMKASWERLGKVNMDALSNILNRLGDAERGGMRKTIGQDAAVIQKHAAKLTQAIQKELDKYDYEKQVRTKFSAALTQMGLFTTQWEKGVRGTFDNAKDVAIRAMSELANALGKTELTLDSIKTPEGLEAFKDVIRNIPDLSAQMLHLTEQQMQSLFVKAQTWAQGMEKIAADTVQEFGRATKSYGMNPTDQQAKDLLSVGSSAVQIDIEAQGGMADFRALLSGVDSFKNEARTMSEEMLADLYRLLVEFSRSLQQEQDLYAESNGSFLAQQEDFRTRFTDGVRGTYKDAVQVADEGMKELAVIAEKAWQFDIETEEGIQQFKKALDSCKYLALDAANMTKEQIEMMYRQVMDLGEQMNNAIKKDYDDAKKQQDVRFRNAGSRDAEKKRDSQIEMRGKTQDAGIDQSLARQIGLGSIAEDPELQRIQNRIYYRSMEYEDAKMRLKQKMELQEAELQLLQEKGATEEELENLRMQQKQERAGQEMLMHEKETALLNETNNLTIQIAQQLQKRVQAINGLIKPVTDFTQAAGRKIGDMIFNMQSEEATWEELWKNMALAVGESVIQMGAQYAQNLIMQQAMAKASEATAIEEATVGTMAGISEGSAKTIGKLGWWGIPLVAVISSLLMGLLQAALSTKKSVDSTSSDASSTTSQTKSAFKLVKGMLTYDDGNVQTFQQAKEGGAYTVLGNDGRVYSAKKQTELKTGIVRQPIATLVGGQPSLVAERGPEMIIGRKTLKDMTQFRPDLVEQIIQFDNHRRRGFRVYDEGNVGELMGNIRMMGDNEQGGSESNADVLASLEESRAVNEQTLAVLAELTAQLQRGIRANINKYGTGGLVEEVVDGLYVTSKRGSSNKLNSLLRR